MSWEISDLTKPAGLNPPGMGRTLKVCNVLEVDVYPETVTPYAAPGDNVTLSGDITFSTGGGFVDWYTTKDTQNMVATKVGQKDSKSMNVEFKAFVPGLSAAFVETLLEDPDILAFVQRANCTQGSGYMIGNTCRPAELMGDFGSGMPNGENDRFGFEVTVKAFVPTLYFYSGLITERP